MIRAHSYTPCLGIIIPHNGNPHLMITYGIPINQYVCHREFNN
jgi:hypothetical protein